MQELASSSDTSVGNCKREKMHATFLRKMPSRGGLITILKTSQFRFVGCFYHVNESILFEDNNSEFLFWGNRLISNRQSFRSSQADDESDGSGVQADVQSGRRTQHDLLARRHIPGRQPHLVLQRGKGEDTNRSFH